MKLNTNYRKIALFTQFFNKNVLGLLISLFVLHAQLLARQPEVKFDCLTLEHGLSQTTVMAIAQDKLGYMWFGTVDGLNKFDGYDFTVYENNPLDPKTISDDWILSLLVGRDGVLWIGTLQGELNRFNPVDNTFTHYDIRPHMTRVGGDRQTLAQLPAIFSFLQPSSIKTIYEDLNGTIWLGTFGRGLFKFNCENIDIK